MELIGISDRAEKMIKSCGYGGQRLMAAEEFLEEPFRFYDDEGYKVNDNVREIVNNFYMIQVGKLGKFADGKFVATENADIDNRFVVYPESIYEASELFDRLSKAVGDYIVPLGVINKDYFAAGDSGRIYVISDEVYAAGESWIDFLNRVAENRIFDKDTVISGTVS